MAGKKDSRGFRVHVTGRHSRRGSRIWGVIVLIGALALVAGGAYFGGYADDKLIQHVHQRDQLAVAACWAFHLRGEVPEGAQDPLLEALEQGDASLRRPAALALGHARNREVVAPLIEALQKDSDPGVRAAAADALACNGNTENPLLEGAIANALDDDHPEVRGAAAHAVGVFGYEAEIPRLIGMLDDTQDKARKGALDALETFTPEGVTYDYNRAAWNGWYAER